MDSENLAGFLRCLWTPRWRLQAGIFSFMVSIFTMRRKQLGDTTRREPARGKSPNRTPDSFLIKKIIVIAVWGTDAMRQFRCSNRSRRKKKQTARRLSLKEKISLSLSLSLSLSKTHSLTLSLSLMRDLSSCNMRRDLELFLSLSLSLSLFPYIESESQSESERW